MSTEQTYSNSRTDGVYGDCIHCQQPQHTHFGLGWHCPEIPETASIRRLTDEDRAIYWRLSPVSQVCMRHSDREAQVTADFVGAFPHFKKCGYNRPEMLQLRAYYVTAHAELPREYLTRRHQLHTPDVNGSGIMFGGVNL